MARWVRYCVQLALKMANSVIGLTGMAMILYSIWMIRLWHSQGHGFWTGGSGSGPRWFIYTFLAFGIYLCFVTCSGYIAAETANGHCISCYTVCIFVLILLEAAMTADVFLNKNWEEDFPEDPTGRFSEFRNFVIHNSKMCEWIGLCIVAAQVMSIFLGLVLRALGPDHGSYDDSDDDYVVPARLPLLRDQGQHTVSIADHHLPSKNDPRNIRIHDKHQQVT